MRDSIFHILFVWYPYVCVSAFIFGSVIRFDREQYSWRASSSQLLRRRSLHRAPHRMRCPLGLSPLSPSSAWVRRCFCSQAETPIEARAPATSTTALYPPTHKRAE